MNIIKKLFTKKKHVRPIRIHTQFKKGAKYVDIDVANTEDLHAVLYFFNTLALEIKKTLEEHPDCSVRISAESWLSGGQLKLEHFQEVKNEHK